MLYTLTNESHGLVISQIPVLELGQRGVGQCILLVPAVTLIQNNQSATLACWGWPALNSITSCVFLSVVLGAPDAPKPFLAPGGPCDEMLMAQ